MLLGKASNGLFDADFDCHESISVAPTFFPPTPAIFGRRSKPQSHRLYICPDAPPRVAYQADDTMILEGRGTGHQTMFPGSVHPSGEDVQWVDPSNIQPAEVPWSVLQPAFAKTAAASLLARHWPQGARHNAALAVAGALKHDGWSALDAMEYMGAIVVAANDEEGDDRDIAVYKTFEKENAVTGWPTVTEIFGKEVADKVHEWLALLRTAKPDRGRQTDFVIQDGCVVRFDRRGNSEPVITCVPRIEEEVLVDHGHEGEKQFKMLFTTRDGKEYRRMWTVENTTKIHATLREQHADHRHHRSLSVEQRTLDGLSEGVTPGTAEFRLDPSGPLRRYDGVRQKGVGSRWRFPQRTDRHGQGTELRP